METELDTAEANAGRPTTLCKETLKKVEVLSRRKRVTDVQRATFRQELQDSLLTSEERLNKIEEVRARQIMAANQKDGNVPDRRRRAHGRNVHPQQRPARRWTRILLAS